jgi:hypothetical protein
MGAKSGNAAAPDPRLVDAQIRSMGIQDSAIQRVLSNSDEMLPMQKEQMRFGLDTSRMAYDQSQQDRTWMLGRRGAVTGTQDQMVADARTFNTDAERERLAGLAGGDVHQAFGAAASELDRSLGRMGVNPSDPRYFSMRSRLSSDEALATATAMNKTRQAAKEMGWSLTDRATNALAGYPAMAAGATGAGAGYGASGLSIANSGLAGVNSGYGAAGTAAGYMGSNATGMYGAQASYKNGQDQIAAANDPFNTILGAGAGALTSWGMGKMFPTNKVGA